MSVESPLWLNTMTRIGYTEKRGNAWHYRRDLQEGRGNHWEGPVPVHAVNSLFFDALEGTHESVSLTEDGVVKVVSPNKKSILRPPGTFGPDDPGGILNENVLDGKPGDVKGWKLHQYREWLVNTLGDVLDTSTEDLGIASAGLLQAGAMAWVQIEAPDNIETQVGFSFRPFILAATAHTGRMSTTYRFANTAVVCDNTFAIAMSEGNNGGGPVRIRHHQNSDDKLSGIREKLGILHKMGDDFALQIEKLADTTVSDGDLAQFLDKWTPLEKDGKPLEGKPLGNANAKRRKLLNLYTSDPRVTPWAGSALGLLQAVNTFEHHVQGTTGKTGDEIAQRNMLRVVQGKRAKMDADTLNIIRDVVAA